MPDPFLLYPSDQPQEIKVKIKFKYNKEIRAIEFFKPIQFLKLQSEIQSAFGQQLSILYISTSTPLQIKIRDQDELDEALANFERLDERNFQLSLSANETAHSQIKDKSIVSRVNSHPNSLHRSVSPPPGCVVNSAPGGVNGISIGGGAFIPDEFTTGQVSNHGSCQSIESSSTSTMSFIETDSSNSSMAQPRFHRRTNSTDFATYPRRSDANQKQVNTVTNNFLHLSSSSINSSNHSVTQNMLSELTNINPLNSPEPPTNWKKGRRLGSGAFGEVYLCYDADTGRELAVKQISVSPNNLVDSASDLATEVAALDCELNILRSLNHERIVQYFGCHRDKDVLCIFMEYMPGGSVKDELKQYGALTENVTRKYCRQILDGILFLHRNMIIHRDIKCANILRDSVGNVKLGDFGCSKRLQSIATASGLSNTVGTPFWMSPEAISGKRCGRKSDIWSIGCTLVEMLTLSPPLSNLEPIAAMYKIVTQDITPQLPNIISHSCKVFISSTLTRDSGQRPSAEQLLDFDFLHGS